MERISEDDVLLGLSEVRWKEPDRNIRVFYSGGDRAENGVALTITEIIS